MKFESAHKAKLWKQTFSQDEKSQRSLGFWAQYISVPHFMANHSIAYSIFPTSGSMEPLARPYDFDLACCDHIWSCVRPLSLVNNCVWSPKESSAIFVNHCLMFLWGLRGFSDILERLSVVWHPASEEKKGKIEEGKGKVFGETTIDRPGLLCVAWQTNLGLDKTTQTSIIFASCQFISYINMGGVPCPFTETALQIRIQSIKCIPSSKQKHAIVKKKEELVPVETQVLED